MPRHWDMEGADLEGSAAGPLVGVLEGFVGGTDVRVDDLHRYPEGEY